MENMRLGNSFPQICVVSVNYSVENALLTLVNIAQTTGYEMLINKSNLICLLMSKRLRGKGWSLPSIALPAMLDAYCLQQGWA